MKATEHRREMMRGYNKNYRLRNLFRVREKGKKNSKKFGRSPMGLVARIYYGQRTRMKRNGLHEPYYSLEELRKWCLGQQIFWVLYDKWVEGGYVKWQSPSIDRIDRKDVYRFNNIQIMTSHENCFEKKAKEISRPVLQIKDGVIINSWPSISRAAEALSGSTGGICEVAKGKRQTCHGYEWEYAS